MMPSGGKRPGAGRKPLLDAETVESIRRDCEQRANLLRRAQAEQRLNVALQKRGYVRCEDGEADVRQLVPLSDRPAVARFGVDEPDNKNLPENLSEEARAAIAFIRDNRRHFAAYEIPLPRLAHGRQEIIAAVAADWGVPERTIRTIWESKP